MTRHIFQIWIPKIFALLLLINASHSSKAQNITYYDKDWNQTTIDRAQFFFVTIDNVPRYRVVDAFKKDKSHISRKQRISGNIVKELDNRKLLEISFSDSQYDSVYIGKKVKIFAAGEYYDYLCRSSDTSIDWPNDAIKSQSGICSKNWQVPKDGDFGIVIWQFREFKGSSGETIFLIKFEDYYIPISGQSLTMKDKFSRNEIELLKMKKQPRRFLKMKTSSELKYKQL